MLLLFTFLSQEEIPFSEFQNFDEKLPHIIEHVLAKYNIDGTVKFGVTPRFIAFGVNANGESFLVKEKIIKGPNKNAPQTAIDGFLRKYSIQMEQCQFDEKNNIIFITPQKNLTQLEISEILVAEIIEGLSKIFTQTMQVGQMQWIRPIHSINAFCNGKRLAVRTPSEDGNVPHSWEEFEKWCSEQNIIYSYENRKEYIINEVSKHANNLQLTWQNNTVSELACLYHSPQICITQFPEKYLSLPQEVLRLTIEKNQRYIMFYKNGIIQNTICIVGNIHNQATTSGHIKTICARLDDASYYILKDTSSFENNCISRSLEKIIFHQKYGSVYKRVEETQHIAKQLFPNNNNLQQAIMLCKNDLNSHIVQSFTELQGYACGYYLEKLGYESSLCIAISQHYKPLNPGDAIPQTTLGLQLSFVDKIHKINALTSIGETPTSSRDPFAIRRDILSIIRIIHSELFECELFTGADKVGCLKSLVHNALHGFVDERYLGFVAEKNS